MAVKKKSGGNAGYEQLRADLAAGTLATAYLFHGEESYLREYYLGQMRRQLVPAGFEEFNYHKLDGKALTAQALTEAAEAMPMLAERTMVQVEDWDLYKLPEEQRNVLIALLEDLPPYCCLVFVYDQVAYKPNKTYKKLYAAVEKHVQDGEVRGAEPGGDPQVGVPALQGHRPHHRRAHGGAPHLHLRQPHERPHPGDRQDLRLRPGGADHQGRTSTRWPPRSWRPRCSR